MFRRRGNLRDCFGLRLAMTTFFIQDRLGFRNFSSYNQPMLTVEDITKLSQVFATKQELNQLEERLTEKMATKDDLNLIMERLDAVFGEVVAMRQEQASHQAIHDHIEDRLRDIEQIPSIAHELRR